MASIKLQGDTSGEITISAPSVAGTTTLDLQATSGTIATTAEVDAVYNHLGVRNLIINGDMRIAQRGTSVTGVTSGNSYHTVDRWATTISGAGTWTQTQDTDVPTGQGFSNSHKFTCTTANASLSASSLMLFRQAIEGQNLQHLKKGTSNAESLTISFWVKSNKTGTYILEVFDSNNTRQISKSYTINSADTWEKKTITFDGDTTGALDNDNGVGIRLQFWMAAGSDRSSGTLSTSWSASNNPDRAVGQVNLADSTSNYINITGVQLEVGTEATPFEHLQYGQQFALCQRYYQVHDQSVNAYYSAGIVGFPFNTVMRASPTLSLSYSGTANRVYRLDTGATSDLTISGTTMTTTGFNHLYAFTPSGWASAAGVGFRSTFVFSAEL